VVLLFTPLFPTSVSGSMRIASVQGNGPTGYFDEREPFSVIQAQTDATEPLYGEDVDLLVWPEGSLDADPFQDDAIARRMTLVATRIGAPLLANAATGRDDRYFNTSMLWNADGTADQIHDKRHPVPFGEYVPDRAFYNAIVPDLIGLIQREYTPGTNPPIVDVDGVPVGLAICFDVIYDDVITEGIGNGAQVLVFQTNNADFRGTDENLQQLSFARMRAIETGRSVVNISTVGTSQVIGSDGVTVTRLDADEAGAMLEDVELRSGLTAGVVLGPWIQLLLVWGGLGALVFGWWRARRR
jgi:apolipoprotein N-acyltransferase